MAETHNIVLLGASFAGINAAHYLLRHVLPSLSSLPVPPNYTVTLVSTSTHLYWTIGAPRAMVSNTLLPASKTFLPIAEGFDSYPTSIFKFLHARASALDPSSRTITLTPLSGDAPTALHYDTLIVATGTTSANHLWTVSEGHEKTIAAYEDIHRRLPSAQSVLIAGGGAAGVETAGEMGSEYGISKSHQQPQKEITLLSGSTQLLSSLQRKTLGIEAEKILKGMGVAVVHGVKVTSVEKGPGEQTTLVKSDGTTEVVDVYVDATGLKPNTDFLPAAWVDTNGRVRCDEKSLRVETAEGTVVDRVYALGAVASYSKGGVLDVWDPIPVLMGNLMLDVSKGMVGKESAYQRKAETMLVPVGRSKGVGVVFGWGVPSLMVWGIKGRTYMIDQLKGERDGVKVKSR